jgi:hypothetical protein
VRIGLFGRVGLEKWCMFPFGVGGGFEKEYIIND